MEGGLVGKIKISNIENSEELFDYLCDVSDSFARMLDENDLEYDQIEDSAELYMSDDAFFCVSLNEFVDYIKDTVSEFPSLTLESEVTAYDTCANLDVKVLYSDRKIKVLWADDNYNVCPLYSYNDYVSLCADYNDTNVLSEEEWNVQNEESDEWYVIGDRKVSHKLDFKFHTSKVIKIKPKKDRFKDLVEEEFVESNHILNKLGITELTEGLTIDGDLKLRNASITKLPKNLTVKGDLDLTHTLITELPEGLIVGGKLKLTDTKIAKLPDDLVVEGIDFKGTKFKSLSECLTYDGNLTLSNTAIHRLLKGISVNDLSIIFPKIKCLKISGNLDLCGTYIKKLPNGLTVNGYLNLSESNITELPEGLTVGGYLYLYNTENIKLPEGLTVKGDLDLSYTRYVKLPEGLTVGGDLVLFRTRNIKLPEGLTVGGDLNLSRKKAPNCRKA